VVDEEGKIPVTWYKKVLKAADFKVCEKPEWWGEDGLGGVACPLLNSILAQYLSSDLIWYYQNSI